MNSANLSWGIIGFIITIVTCVVSIVLLATSGYTDPILFGGLVTLANSALIALSTTMNPNRKMQDELGEIKAVKRELAHQTGEAITAVNDVKKLLK